MSSTFLSEKKLKITNSRPIHKRKKQVVMKKYVHIRARGPTTLSRNEGTEKHSILLQ